MRKAHWYMRLSFVVSIFYLAMPAIPASFHAGGCTYDLTGTTKLCNGFQGAICYSGVKTCGPGTKLSLCKDGTERENSGEFTCFHEDPDCAGRQYHPVTNATGCEPPATDVEFEEVAS